MITKEHETVLDRFGEREDYSYLRVHNTVIKVNPVRQNQEKENSQRRGRHEVRQLGAELRRQGKRSVNITDLQKLSREAKCRVDSETIDFKNRGKVFLNSIKPKNIAVVENKTPIEKLKLKKEAWEKERGKKVADLLREHVWHLFKAWGSDEAARNRLYAQYKNKRLINSILEDVSKPKNHIKSNIEIRKGITDFEKSVFAYLKSEPPSKESKLENFYLKVQKRIEKRVIRHNADIESIRDILIQVIPEKYLVI